MTRQVTIFLEDKEYQYFCMQGGQIKGGHQIMKIEKEFT